MDTRLNKNGMTGRTNRHLGFEFAIYAEHFAHCSFPLPKELPSPMSFIDPEKCRPTAQAPASALDAECDAPREYL